MTLDSRLPTTSAPESGGAPAEGLAASPEYSVVIPVFNSAPFVGDTIAACVRVLDRLRVSFELILVDDGSRDGAWHVLESWAAVRREIVAIRLLRNYGQHTAVYCGLAHSRGRYVITLDDDLQTPAEEMVQLISRRDSADALFGSPVRKHHPLARRLGSAIIHRVNRGVFGQPPDLVVSSFRLLHRDVVDRMLRYRVREPYINGLAVMCAARTANVSVEHRPRAAGRSGYGPIQLITLVTRILFNYSSFPLRVVSTVGLLVAILGLVLSMYFAGRALLVGRSVPGWASLAVLLSFFNGVSLLLLGMLGEYIVRILDQFHQDRPYEVAQFVSGRDQLAEVSSGVRSET